MSGREVYALDLAGHGGSRGPAPGTIGGHVDRLLDWRRQVDLGPVILFGHSMGAAIALTAALRHPDSVEALVLIGATARMKVNPEILRLTADEARRTDAHLRIVNLSFSPGTSARVIEAAQTRVDAASLAALHKDFLACERFDLSARLNEIELPALVVCGEHDLMTPLSSCRELARDLPNARFKILLHAGHLAMLERPMDAARVVRDFLSCLDPRNSATAPASF